MKCQKYLHDIFSRFGLGFCRREAQGAEQLQLTKKARFRENEVSRVRACLCIPEATHGKLQYAVENFKMNYRCGEH